MGKWMVSLVNSHTNATSERWHLWEIDLTFALKSIPGWPTGNTSAAHDAGEAGAGIWARRENKEARL
jgi:hypothetical protein